MHRLMRPAPAPCVYIGAIFGLEAPQGRIQSGAGLFGARLLEFLAFPFPGFRRCLAFRGEGFGLGEGHAVRLGHAFLALRQLFTAQRMAASMRL